MSMSNTKLNNDFLPLLGTDFIELYVGNAKQSAHYYKTAFGFQGLAYSGPETGDKGKVSYALRQEKVTLVLTTPLNIDSEWFSIFWHTYITFFRNKIGLM